LISLLAIRFATNFLDFLLFLKSALFLKKSVFLVLFLKIVLAIIATWPSVLSLCAGLWFLSLLVSIKF